MSQTNKNGTLITRMACAIFFLLFTILYLYDYQADTLAVTQHVLSNGATHYNRVIGTIIITVVLWLLQIGIYKLTGLNRRGHALTYIPSLLLLGILTDVSPDIACGHYLGNWLWAFPLLMVAYVAVVWVVRQLEPMELPATSLGFFSRMTWINMLQLVVMALIVCCIGCSDEVFHYRMRSESYILNGDYAKAANVGINSEKTDSSLTMLRIWSLSESGQLPERLFEYPLVGKSDAMMPNGKSVKLMMVPLKLWYKQFGVYFTDRKTPMSYLLAINKTKYSTKQTRDWLLCAYLLDGNLDAFVTSLTHYYNIKGPLPQAYREALTLYTHLREHPRVIYHVSVMDADYDDFRKLFYSTTNPLVRNATLKENYGKTYWYYYLLEQYNKH